MTLLMVGCQLKYQFSTKIPKRPCCASTIDIKSAQHFFVTHMSYILEGISWQSYLEGAMCNFSPTLNLSNGHVAHRISTSYFTTQRIMWIYNWLYTEFGEARLGRVRRKRFHCNTKYYKRPCCASIIAMTLNSAFNSNIIELLLAAISWQSLSECGMRNSWAQLNTPNGQVAHWQSFWYSINYLS